MSEDRRSLRELVQAANDRGITYREMEKRSDGKISRATFNGIATGRHSLRFQRTEEAVQAIALAIGEPTSVIREALGVPEAPPEFLLPERANKLSAEQRRTVISVIDTILRAQDDDESETPQTR